jgi:hypothetical protein
MTGKPATGSVRHHLVELRHLIPALSHRQLESLQRALIDLLTDVSSEKSAREQESPAKKLL